VAGAGAEQVERIEPIDAAGLLALLRERPTEELAETFRELDALRNVTDAHQLLVVAVLDERGIGTDDGTVDTIGWVMWTSRLSRARARALVETARALPERPRVATAALEGRLSGEQLEAAVMVATPETDGQWAEDAPGLTPSSLRAAAKNARGVTREEAVERDDARVVTYRWDQKRGGLRLRGWFPDVDGAIVAASLESRAERMKPAPGEPWEPFGMRCADAVVEALSRELEDRTDASRATVVLHVTESALREGSTEPGAHLDAGTETIPIANETARRIACESAVQELFESADGVPIRMGRRTRKAPPRLWRLLRDRDRHCQAPGCSRTLGMHSHHVQHWIDGGKTDVDNLLLLCTVHHRMLHEHGWTIRGEHGELRFYDRHGIQVTPNRAPPLDPAIRDRLIVSTT
jgi:hypothetical protein